MKTVTIRDFYLREAVFTKEQLEQALAEFDKPTFDYPICCVGKEDKAIILFDGIESGVVLKQGDHPMSRVIGETYGHWIDHTDSYWTQIPYDREKGFYHKQPVYCWQDEDTHSATLRFYDAENKESVFAFNGSKLYSEYDNYSAKMPEHMKEFKEN